MESNRASIPIKHQHGELIIRIAHERVHLTGDEFSGLPTLCLPVLVNTENEGAKTDEFLQKALSNP